MRIGVTSQVIVPVTLTVEQKLKATDVGFTGVCRNCNHDLTEKEVQEGWTENPEDFTTECPKCKTRFEANLVVTFDEETVSLDRPAYLCKPQLFAELTKAKGERQVLGIKYLYNNFAHLLYNMVKHFGTYAKGLRAYLRSMVC